MSNAATLPNHNERQLLQRLRGRGWVKAFELPVGTMLIQRLLEKRWIECQGAGNGAFFRITDAGMAAKIALIPLKRR